jgi:hypothetical protein
VTHPIVKQIVAEIAGRLEPSTLLGILVVNEQAVILGCKSNHAKRKN